MIDVVALGELLIDFAAKSEDSAGYPTMAANPGGAPGNFLAALNACGKKTAFIGMANTHKDNNEIPLRAREVLPGNRKDFSFTQKSAGLRFGALQ